MKKIISNDVKKEIFKKLLDPKFYADDEPIFYTNDNFSKIVTNEAYNPSDNK